MDQGEVKIVESEFTGRVMEGRRWNRGLHQAVEARARPEDESISKKKAGLERCGGFLCTLAKRVPIQH